jgi:hypothetical protein
MRTLKLMADYQCFPLWEVSPGGGRNIDPNILSISDLLRHELMDWAEEYDRTLNFEDPAISGFPNADAVSAFKAEGVRLADKLREELGSSFHVMVNINAYVRAERT